MPNRFDLVALADAVHASATADDARAKCAAIMRAHEFGWACLHLDLPLAQDNPYADHPGLRTFGVLWDGALDAQLRRVPGDLRRSALRPYRQIRPTLMFLRRFRGPLMVDLRNIVEVAPASNVAEIARIALEDFGQHNAIVMPLTDLSSGRCSSLSLWDEGPRTDFKAFAQARVGALQMAGLHLRALFDVGWPLDAAASREAARLSDRERQVLVKSSSNPSLSGAKSCSIPFDPATALRLYPKDASRSVSAVSRLGTRSQFALAIESVAISPMLRDVLRNGCRRMLFARGHALPRAISARRRRSPRRDDRPEPRACTSASGFASILRPHRIPELARWSRTGRK